MEREVQLAYGANQAAPVHAVKGLLDVHQAGDERPTCAPPASFASNQQAQWRWQTYMVSSNLPHSATMDSVSDLYKFLEAELKELVGGTTAMDSSLSTSGVPHVKAIQKGGKASKGAKNQGKDEKQEAGKGQRTECINFKKFLLVAHHLRWHQAAAIL